jgi:hypothetical protein
MFVKPMVTGVHCTVLMDCCHSGTVMDLPYRFGADDSKMRREKGFNMDILTGGKGARKGNQAGEPSSPKKEPSSPKKEQSSPKKKKADDKKKKKNPNNKNKKPKEKEEEKEEEVIEVGPKMDANGVPQLPIRKAREKARPPPSKKCSIM